MPAIVRGSLDEPASVDAAAQTFADWNPGFRIETQKLDGDWLLESDAVAYCWVVRGRGAVWLDAGYRTQEGDGQPLPVGYESDRTASVVAEALQTLEKLRNRIAAAATLGVEGLLARFQGVRYVGDPMGELWRIREACRDVDRWWQAAAPDSAEAAEAIRTVIEHAGGLGWATKVSSGWEPLRIGDQLIVTPARMVRGRGAVVLWRIVDEQATETHCTATRRLPYLRDTAGGCAPGFDAFRRLPLTWRTEPDGGPGDGRNRLNSHVVNIAAEQSRTHYHPTEAVGGGRPQCELYLVLDPAALGLSTAGRPAFLDTFPDVGDWRRHERTSLRLGDVVVIPPGTGHRGVDAFVNVVTLPGFKPGNEFYVDDAIAFDTGGASPYNPAFAPSVAAR